MDLTKSPFEGIRTPNELEIITVSNSIELDSAKFNLTVIKSALQRFKVWSEVRKQKLNLAKSKLISFDKFNIEHYKELIYRQESEIDLFTGKEKKVSKEKYTYEIENLVEAVQWAIENHILLLTIDMKEFKKLSKEIKGSIPGVRRK